MINVIYRINKNERAPDEQFPKLHRNFESVIVERGMDNPHVALLKWTMNNREDGIVYAVGHVKEEK